MRLLIIGSVNGQMVSASAIAQRRGAKVTHCQDIASGLESLRNGKGADLVMVDVVLDVAALIGALRNERIHVPVIACGSEHDSASAVKAIKAGAKEYVPLPPDEALIAAVLEAITLDRADLIYQAPSMRQMVQLATQVAPSEASILITGESGTGKEVIAQYIHRQSKRAGREMISLNCAAIPDNLLESELFGHEKGAFTGAVARRVGKFEEASGSTLLLDEISEMDLKLQAKLLRAIQERQIDRVGGTKPVPVNIRIIATSNRNLAEEVKKGKFREDLYFRLNVIHLALPPLRKRREDIRLFAEYFGKKYAAQNAVPIRSFSSGALTKMERYEWPGNVRELENAVHRAVLLAGENLITEYDIMTANSIDGSENTDTAANTEGDAVFSTMVGRTMQSVEKELIIKTLDHCLGNRTHAANILGISIRTLRNKLHEYEQNTAE